MFDFKYKMNHLAYALIKHPQAIPNPILLYVYLIETKGCPSLIKFLEPQIEILDYNDLTSLKALFYLDNVENMLSALTKI